MASIYNIIPEHLEETFLEQVIYPSLELDCFWTDDWSPANFRRLSRAGFLTISCPLPNGSPVLLAQLHTEYSVLDWPNLHIGRKVRKLIRSGDLRERKIHLRFTSNPRHVCMGIRKAYGDRAWLTPRYAQMITQLGQHAQDGVQTIATEIWSGDKYRLGGEIGYLCGATYTSLTGYLNRSTPQMNNLGKIQLIALGLVLKQCGYAFWNLGQTQMQYKQDLGAKNTPRPDHLKRWREAINTPPIANLADLVERSFDCQALLSEAIQ